MTKRNTLQKEIILNTVRSMHNHPSAEEIYTAINQNYPSISKGTVYRNLSQMADSGEIRRVEVPNAPDRFDFNLNRHEHLKCRICGRVYDVNVPAPQMPPPSDGVDADGYCLIYHGVCADCRTTNYNS